MVKETLDGLYGIITTILFTIFFIGLMIYINIEPTPEHFLDIGSKMFAIWFVTSLIYIPISLSIDKIEMFPWVSKRRQVYIKNWL